MTIQIINLEPVEYFSFAVPKTCSVPRMIREIVGQPYEDIFEVVLVSGQKIYVKYDEKKDQWVEVTDW